MQPPEISDNYDKLYIVLILNYNLKMKVDNYYKIIY